MGLRQLGLPQLRELLPRGVCDAPNPLVYRQLARLCSSADDRELLEELERGSSSSPGDHRSPDGHHLVVHLHRLEREPGYPDYDDPNTRYIWDEEEDCQCRQSRTR